MDCCRLPRFSTRGLMLTAVLIFAGFGCSSEVGSAPSGKDQMNAYIAKEADATATSGSKKEGNKVYAPKNIKSKLGKMRGDGPG
jgi:hypothetical protein